MGHKKTQNMRDIIVSSRLRFPPVPSTPKGIINPTKLCNITKCRYCPLFDLSGIAKSTTTGQTYIVPQKITSKINNLMYLITCQTCRHQYVGQTENSLASRFQQHLLSIDHCTDWTNAPRSAIEQGPTNVGLHFSAHDNSNQVLQIPVLEFVKFSPKYPAAKAIRENIEQHWMYKLKTLTPFGIYATDGSNHSKHCPNRPRPAPQPSIQGSQDPQDPRPA